MTAPLDIVLSEDGNLFARQDRLLVQVRRGRITIEVLDRIGAEVRAMLASVRGPTGFVAVLEPTAETVSLAVRERQRLIVKATETQGDVKMALVVVGDGIQASLSRSIARALLHRNHRLKVAHDVDGAAQWVSAHIGIHARDVVAAVQESRRLAATT